MSLDTAFLDRLAAAAVAEGLTDVVYGTVPTPLGTLLVAQSDRGLCRIGFGDEPETRMLAELAERVGPRVVASAAGTARACEALVAYLEGEQVDLDLPVDLRLVSSAFQRQVLVSGLGRVRRGEVATYGELAEAIGHPRAARATGTALARNPVPIVVPCHRVVPAGGSIGNYGGSPWRKRFLLELEGAI
jgi:methylated-DNA-[protein]-cysteine S-methyltransferase